METAKATFTTGLMPFWPTFVITQAERAFNCKIYNTICVQTLSCIYELVTVYMNNSMTIVSVDFPVAVFLFFCFFNNYVVFLLLSQFSGD